MIQAIVALLMQLAHAHLVHTDLKSDNILIMNNEPYLIDLDAMAYIRSNAKFKSKFNKDIKRFLKNWNDNPHLLELFEKQIKLAFTFYHSE